LSRERRKADATAEKSLKGLAAVASRLGAFKPAHEVLVPVRSVKTVFPSFNHVSKVGGWPTARFNLLHGESGDGKTKFGMGIGLSFLQAGGFFAHHDAENTTPIDWPRSLFGEWVTSPGFVATRISGFEQTRSEVRRFCETFAEARIKKEIPEETPAFYLLDSVRKLVPEKIWEELTKEAQGKPSRGRGGQAKKRGVDGYGGRAAQLKAALNAAWLDELIPLLAQTDVAMGCIARETLDEDGEVKIGGGAALYYDSSLVARVERDGYITNGATDRKDEVVYGERHAVVVRKTKVAGREERWPTAYFHSSNGQLEGVPAGFDPQRDVLELALSLGVAEQKGGGWITFGEERIGQGANKCTQLLHARPALYQALTLAVENAPKK